MQYGYDFFLAFPALCDQDGEHRIRTNMQCKKYNISEDSLRSYVSLISLVPFGSTSTDFGSWASEPVVTLPCGTHQYRMCMAWITYHNWWVSSGPRARGGSCQARGSTSQTRTCSTRCSGVGHTSSGADPRGASSAGRTYMQLVLERMWSACGPGDSGAGA